MKHITVTPVTTKTDFQQYEGEFFNPDDSWIILDNRDESIKVFNENNKLLCCIDRNRISEDLCNVATNSFLVAGKTVSTNRGIAAGKKERILTTNYERGVPSNSSIVGYIDNIRHNEPCRLTAFSRKYFQKYNDGIPFIQEIDNAFRENVPDAWKLQRDEAMITNFHIENTAFSTVTVNYNFRTALHKDTGDFEEGFGNLVVCQKDISGGWLLFPRYKVGIIPYNGDFIAMDVHEWHCNSDIIKENENAYRLSFVCYLRSRMRNCNTVNNRLLTLPKSTIEICRDIFKNFDEELPEKTVIGIGKQGKSWYEYKGQKCHLIYKNKRFILIDINKNIKINNLLPAWDYSITIKTNSDNF